MPQDVQLRAIIRGRVQGVGFRFFAIHSARRRRLTGWVRNLANGNVEVMAEGSRDALARLLGELRTGPRGAWVRDVQAEWQPASGQYDDFHVVPPSYE